jgi:hypothetical protein
MKFQLLLFFISFIITTNGFSSEDDGIPIHYVAPEPTDLLNENSIRILKSRTISFLTTNGISGDGGYSDIVVYPVINLISENEIEATKNLKLYTLEIQLVMKEVNNNKIYGTTSVIIKGDGYDKLKATQNAIVKLSFNNASGKQFIDDSKGKVIKYYQENCERFLKEAETLSRSGIYNQAISICYSVPKSVDCYQKALNLSLKCYNYLQETNCKKTLIKAEGYITSRDYQSAIRTLGTIDPRTSCYENAKNKLKEIDSKLSAIEESERKRIEEEKRLAYEKYQNNQKLERYRIDAVRDIAIEYYRNKPKTVYNYNYIIR